MPEQRASARCTETFGLAEGGVVRPALNSESGMETFGLAEGGVGRPAPNSESGRGRGRETRVNSESGMETFGLAEGGVVRPPPTANLAEGGPPEADAPNNESCLSGAVSVRTIPISSIQKGPSCTSHARCRY